MGNVTNIADFRARKQRAVKGAKGYGISYVTLQEEPLQKFMTNVDALNAQLSHWDQVLKTSRVVQEREQAAINIFDLKIKLVDIITNATSSRNEAIVKIASMRTSLVTLEIKLREEPDTVVRTRLWQEAEVLKVGINNLQRVIDL